MPTLTSASLAAAARYAAASSCPATASNGASAVKKTQKARILYLIMVPVDGRQLGALRNKHEPLRLGPNRLSRLADVWRARAEHVEKQRAGDFGAFR